MMSTSKNSLEASANEIMKLSGKSPVSNLQESINLAINLQAENLRLIVEGKEVKNPIDPKVWADLLKMVEIMPKLELFERISNGEVVSEAKVSTKKETEVVETNDEITGNSFEERSKVIKAKLNGKTAISTKTD
jgi:hypothetical protein